MTELIKELSLCFAPSGLEDEVIALIEEKTKNYADEICRTQRGALYIKIKGKTDKAPLCICAPTDETAFIISETDDKGFIRVKELTPYNRGSLCGQAVTVGNENNRFPGVMAGILHRCSNNDRERPDCEHMFVDLGANGKDELKDKIRMGDFVIFANQPEKLGENKVCGKALTRSILCSLMIENIIKTKQSGKMPEQDIIFFFDIKTLMGASDLFSVINKEAPEKVLILSALPTIPDKDKKYPKCSNGIVVPSNDGAYLYYANDIYKKALSSGAKVQFPIATAAADKSASCGYTSCGAKLIRGCIPVENINTGCEIADMRDAEELSKLICSFTE